VTGFKRQTRVAQSYARIDIVASLSANFAESGAGYTHASIPITAVVKAVQRVNTGLHVADTRVANRVAACKQSCVLSVAVAQDAVKCCCSQLAHQLALGNALHAYAHGFDRGHVTQQVGVIDERSADIQAKPIIDNCLVDNCLGNVLGFRSFFDASACTPETRCTATFVVRQADGRYGIYGDTLTRCGTRRVGITEITNLAVHKFTSDFFVGRDTVADIVATSGGAGIAVIIVTSCA
jgi:hypothetical protein